MICRATHCDTDYLCAFYMYILVQCCLSFLFCFLQESSLVSFCTKHPACCFTCLPHPFRDEELETQVLQSSVQVRCHLLVFLPGLLQPLEGDKDHQSYVIITQELRRGLCQHCQHRASALLEANSESNAHFLPQ